MMNAIKIFSNSFRGVKMSFESLVCDVIYSTDLSYVYTLRLIGPISHSGECDLMIHHESTSSFSHECILLPYEIGAINRSV